MGGYSKSPAADYFDTDSRLLRLPPWYDKNLKLIDNAERSDSAAPKAPDPENPALLDRASAAMRLIVEEELGGAWWGRRCHRGWTADHFQAMAVAIPTKAEDMPVVESMLAEVERNLPKEKTLILAGAGRGAPALAGALRRLQKKGATVIVGEANPWKLFSAVSLVHAAGHTIGFLALLAGKPVVCHGPAFYAGRGLTQDRAPAAKGLSRRTLSHLFAEKFLLGARYRDPYSGETICFEKALEIVRFFRRLDEQNRSIGVCMGMAFWKKARIADFLTSSEGAPRFTRSVRKAVRHAAKQGKDIAVWASREPADLAERAAAAGVRVIRVEDGFIRSAGLGADFIPPCSLSLDGEGLYFDPARPSGLERILNSIELDTGEIFRTRKLMALLVSRNITKYSAGARGEVEIPGGRTILVPGQVEDDRSVLMGGAGMTGNLELLSRVRADNPDAHILYKPHPDVRAGHRPGEIAAGLVLRHADQIVRTGSMGELIAGVDEVHCLTSLAGFEALLRDKRVVTYGQPFYAGWGLTIDRNPPPRRGRKITLEQLVAGTLLRYARYFDPLTKLPCTAEVLLSRFDDPDLWRPTVLVRLRRIEGRIVYHLRAIRRLFVTKAVHQEAP
ncbi:MAG: hypothetical protein P4L43_16975 [Syntrophobacteraceae bacterium]|nr:hypothetical protein [Syntrophobacteraceae bacterium]